MNFEILLTNPELANNIRFEIKGSDLLELTSTLIRVAKEHERIEPKETYLTIDDVCKMTNRKRMAVWRWKRDKVLVPNQLGLYKKSDVDKFLEKK
ncbi:MAG: helix-turn-helix domain-containing protein [Dysgonomonas sp.]